MIESQRLYLRKPLVEDFEEMALMFMEPEVIAHLWKEPLGRAEAWTKFLRDVGHWTVEPFGLFSILDKSTGAYVGKVGYARFERDLGVQAGTAIEMAWTLRSQYHGRGYALEAANLAKDWFEARHPCRTACTITPSNTPSIKLAERIGYKRLGIIGAEDNPNLLLVRDPI